MIIELKLYFIDFVDTVFCLLNGQAGMSLFILISETICWFMPVIAYHAGFLYLFKYHGL